MIDFSNETVLTLSQAAERLPRRRAGKKTHVATLYRWASRGLRGVTLEVIRVGGTTCTSVEALQRFFDALDNTYPVAAPARSNTQRAGQIRQASEKLQERDL